MKIYAFVEIGIGKSISEDTVLVGSEIIKEGFFFSQDIPHCICVADGVGGNAGGREASEFVINKMLDAAADDLIVQGKEINTQLLSYASTVPGKENMATTFSGLFFNNGTPKAILHVGNTRVYAIRGMYVKQLTKDHTTVEWLKDRGQFEAAENAPSNEITACFGSGNEARLKQLSVYEIDRPYSGYILTSDGIHDYLDDEEIEDFLTTGEFTESSFIEIANRAKANGSSDDKSIIVIML